MKHKRLSYYAITMIVLFSTMASASERFFSLQLSNSNGAILFRNIALLEGKMPQNIAGDGYSLKVMSFYGAALEEFSFSSSENNEFVLYTPYYKEAKEIRIFKGKSLIFSYDISAFSNVCGDNICQGQESYEDCKKDCPSGSKDDFCDRVRDNRCDPDCSPALDADCKVLPKEMEKEQEINKKLAEGRETITKEIETKEDGIKTGTYLSSSLLFGIIILILVVFFWTKYILKHKIKANIRGKPAHKKGHK